MVKKLWVSASDLESKSIEQLREIVQRHRRIFESSSGYGFWDLDMRTGQFEWSGEFWQTLGYGEEDAEYVNAKENLLHLIHPEDFELADQAIRRHFKFNESIDLPLRVKVKDGPYRWSHCLADSVRDENGRVIYLSGINFDISNLKKLEEENTRNHARHMRIINAAIDGIWEWSLEDDSFFYSKSCLEQVGLSVPDTDDSMGMDQLREYINHVVAEDRPVYDEALRRHLKNEAPYDVEYRVRGKDGKLRWIRSKGQAVFTEDGRAIRMSGTNTNITALKEAEDKVVRAKEAAEKANRAKSEFLSSMSHELRTPLNSILGFAQLFDYDTNLSDEQRQNMREIRRAGQHLLQLINDVLDLAKIESGKITLSLEPVLPIRIVDECVTLLNSLADARGVHLRVETQGFEHLYVQADAVRLKQVVLNLVSNGIKYNREGGSVTVLFSADRDKSFTIRVQDTGYGIPVEHQKAVFEPFNRLGAEESGTEGSGVGLVITKQLVEMMEAQLSFYSEVGQGTCFEILLKQRADWSELSNEEKTRLAKLKPGSHLNIKGKRHILYIEDNPSNLRLMEQLLQRFPNIRLQCASEAFKGLYIARTEAPDLVILDINLPGMDGYEILNVLKHDPSTAHIPVVALSANAMNYDIERGIQAGFEEYLTKPVIFEELIGVLNKWLAAGLKTA